MHSFHSIDDGQHVEFEDEISHVIAELLSLLFVAVRIMPDMDAFELTNGPLCAKCLIVGIHHKSSDVRAGMIKLLAAYFSRCVSTPKMQVFPYNGSSGLGWKWRYNKFYCISD